MLSCLLASESSARPKEPGKRDGKRRGRIVARPLRTKLVVISNSYTRNTRRTDECF
jgi:hypothetical protein